jgi:hypothetical protein
LKKIFGFLMPGMKSRSDAGTSMAKQSWISLADGAVFALDFSTDGGKLGVASW